MKKRKMIKNLCNQLNEFAEQELKEGISEVPSQRPITETEEEKEEDRRVEMRIKLIKNARIVIEEMEIGDIVETPEGIIRKISPEKIIVEKK